jgi:phospholipid/cholesterol/gamma-HCH transport system substrate-binding protein
MKFRIRYADQVVGAFVLLAFALATLIIVAVGSKQRWFARDIIYTSRFSSGAGLNSGTSITLKGFQIGRIQTVCMNDNNEAEVVFVVFDNYRDKVMENSLLELVVSPIGLGNQLLFHQGRSELLAEPGSFIPSYETPEGKRLVDLDLVARPPKDDTISRLLSNLNPLLENINAAVLRLDQTLDGVNGPSGTRIANIMDNVEESVPRVFSDVEDSLATLQQTLESIAVIGKNLEKTSEVLSDPTGLVPKLLDPKGSLATLLDDSDRLFNSVEASLQGVDASIGNLRSSTAILVEQMPRLASTLDEARKAIIMAQDVMEGLKNNPLLKGGISERTDARAAPTSLRDTDF